MVRLSMSNFKTLSFVASLCSLVALAPLASGQQWSQYGKDAQHTGSVTTQVQRLKAILWQTPVDLYPPYSGTDLFLHYGSTLISQNGTVLVTVRTGSTGGTWPPSANTFRVDGRNIGTGSLIWSENTDWTPPPYGWVPPCGSAVGPDNRVWTPGAGGTVYIRSTADSASATVSQVAFYGNANYTANTSTYNNDVRICTPITVDSSGNAYFGYWVSPGSTTGLTSGFARISSGGVCTYVSANSLTGLTGEVPSFNASPALSNDGTQLYVAMKYGGTSAGSETNFTSSQGRLAVLNSTTLAAVNVIIPTNPSGSTPYYIDDSSGTIMVGTDGDIYWGTLSSGNLWSRGFMTHYSADLNTAKTMGAFGWDDTASLVPASAVPSYTGTSPYLILTKYNNYADPGVWGDGKNKIAILDPNDTESFTVQYGSHNSPPNATGPTYTTMKEILTILGQTPNANTYSDGQPYDGFREWCINDAAVSSGSKAAIINSEDGHCYYWDLTTGNLLDSINLAPPTGEAYTPTIVSSDGISFAVNNAQLVAMWDGAGPSSFSFSPNPISAGDGTTGTINLSAAATGPGATISLSCGNPHIHVPSTVTVPSGSSSTTFPITTDVSDSSLTGTITATRYNVSASTTSFSALGSGIGAVNLAANPVAGGNSSSGAVVLSYFAPSSGRTVTMSTDLSCVHFTGSTTLTYPGGNKSQNFTFNTDALSSSVTGHIIATLDDGTSMSKSITVQAPQLNTLSYQYHMLLGGQSMTGTLTATGHMPAAGINVTFAYNGAHVGTGDPTSMNVTSLSTPLTLHTSAVTTAENDSVQATFEGKTLTWTVTVEPPTNFTGFTVDNNSPYMTYQVTGTVQFSSVVAQDTTLTVTTSDNYVAAVAAPKILAGNSSAQFTMNTGILPTGYAHNTTVTVGYQGTYYAQTISIQPIFLNPISPSYVTVHSNATVNLTVTITHPAGAYTISPKVHCSDANVHVPVQINFAAGVSSTVLRITTGTITTTGQGNVYVGPLCGGNKTVIVRYSP